MQNELKFVLLEDMKFEVWRGKNFYWKSTALPQSSHPQHLRTKDSFFPFRCYCIYLQTERILLVKL